MKKWKTLFITVCMAFLLGFGGIVSHAATHVPALEAAKQEGSDITVKNYGDPENSDYSFRLKRTEQTTCTWTDASGVNGKKPYHQKGASIERWGQMVTSDAQKGKISCYLTNMGNYKGKSTNLKITFTDWPDYRTESGERYYPVVGVVLSLTTDLYGLTFSDIWYEAKLEIFDDQGNPLKVDMTYRAEDLDYGQILGISKNDSLSGMNIPEDSRVYYKEEDGFHYFYADNIDSQEYEKDSVQIQYEDTSVFTLRVGGGVALPGTCTYEKYVTKQLQEAYSKFEIYMEGERAVEEVNEGGVTLGWIAGSAKGYGKFITPTPQKNVSKTDIHGSEPYEYQVNFKIPECQPADYYEYIVMTDTLPEAVTCDTVTVFDADNEKEVTSSFDIQTEKGVQDKVEVRAKDTSSGWIYGKTLEVRITVHKRPDYIFGNSNEISNTAFLKTDLGEKESKPVTNRFYFQIQTEVKNGTITSSDQKAEAGSTKKIQYAPEEGFELESISVDGNTIDPSKFPSEYSFTKLNADHQIKVIYNRNPVLTITKEVKGAYEPYGVPTFLFRISGEDIDGGKRTFYRMISFDDPFGEEEIRRKSVTVNVPAGTWTVCEIEVARYRFTGIKEVEHGTVKGEEAELQTLDHNDAKATFCNELSNYRNLSHNDVIVNRFGKEVGE